MDTLHIYVIGIAPSFRNLPESSSWAAVFMSHFLEDLRWNWHELFEILI